MATSRTKSQRPAPTSGSSDDVPVVGARDACPCGSGRRYKACHGRKARESAAPFVSRPFEGLAGETDWVAMREFVPAGTAALTLAGAHAGRSATAATLLPMIAPGMVRPDGEVLVGLQTTGGSGDPSRDYAAVLERLLDAEPGAVIESVGMPGTGPRLQDLLDPSAPLVVEVRESFEFWHGTVDDSSGLVTASIERADAAITPTTRLEGVEAAYWCRVGDRDYLRWVLPQAEDVAVDALARLHAAGEDTLGDDTRMIGAFRAHGLLVAVWDLPPGGEAAELEAPAATFAERYAAATELTEPLTTAERSARAGLVNRQRTLR